MPNSDPISPVPEYAKVIAVSPAEEFADVRGLTGVVLGGERSDDETGWTYAVLFPRGVGVVMVGGASLRATGEIVSEDMIYGGERVRVRVDERGDGEFVP